MIDDAIRAVVADAVRAEGDRIVRAIVAELRASRPPRLLSVDEAAREARVSPCTLRRWEAAGYVRSVRRGSRVLIDMASLQPEGEAAPTMPSDALPGSGRRGADAGPAGVTPLRRRGGGQS